MFLNILLVFALLAVAFASAADQKVDAKSQAHFPQAYMFTREPEAVHSASASSLRTSTDRKVSANVKVSEEGDYLFITYSENKGYCGGPDFAGEFYKVGECFNTGDDQDGNSMGSLRLLAIPTPARSLERSTLTRLALGPHYLPRRLCKMASAYLACSLTA